jgi:tetratricopeptide (TPR) repeat protein
MLAAQSSGGDKNIWIKCCNYNKKLKNYRQAEYCITRALKLDKKNLYILYERGALNEELGDIFKAIRIYTVLLKLYPNYDILLHIIILYERRKLEIKNLFRAQKPSRKQSI